MLSSSHLATTGLMCLVIEVDEVGAVDVIVGASGCIGYPISSLEQFRSRCKRSGNLLVTILVTTRIGTGN